jgi:hypothetical protein
MLRSLGKHYGVSYFSRLATDGAYRAVILLVCKSEVFHVTDQFRFEFFHLDFVTYFTLNIRMDA